ncbi:hypothetical protein NSPZN2_110055 [Nitrospira defluvii]|uniref:Uncharacterized protein n=1 Tax=Nitrospira defluvii TaxID=330214 RepID=A0ABM8R7F3_9BACT|nr:hypothetical protein NSPZN2_110055 [Nitrospira defluvii]
MRHQPQMLPHIPHAPAFLAEKTEPRLIQCQWMNFARQEFEERGLAGSVWSDYRRMLTRLKQEGKIGEDAGIPPVDGGVLNVENRQGVRGLGLHGTSH